MQLHFTPLFIMRLVCFGWVLLAFLSPPVARAETQIQTGTTPTTAYLQVGDQILLDQPGFHLSKPTLSPDGRWLAATLVPTGAGTVTLAETYLFDTNDGQQIARLVGYSPSWSADSTILAIETEEGVFAYNVLEQRLQRVEQSRLHQVHQLDLATHLSAGLLQQVVEVQSHSLTHRPTLQALLSMPSGLLIH